MDVASGASEETLFAGWRAGGFEPGPLPEWVWRSKNAKGWLARAIKADPVRGVRVLMYNLDHTACAEIAREVVTDEWAMQLMTDRGEDPEVLELFVVLAEGSFCRDLIADHLISRISEGSLCQAFARALNDRAPPDIVSQTAHALAGLGYPEILEDEGLLRREWTVAHGYLQLLSASQYKQLCNELGIKCVREILARWLCGDAPIEHAPIPAVPAQFFNAASFYHWTYETLVFGGTLAAAAAWANLRDRSADLHAWWSAVRRGREGHKISIDETRIGRRLDIRDGAADPEFKIRFRGELRDPFDLLSDLREAAHTLDPIYGQSARGAQVALRADPEKVTVLTRLEAIEVLSAREINRYFYLFGADTAATNIETALRLADSPGLGGKFDLVTVDKAAPFALVATLLVRIFPPSCRLVAAQMGESTLGLQRCSEPDVICL